MKMKCMFPGIVYLYLYKEYSIYSSSIYTGLQLMSRYLEYLDTGTSVRRHNHFPAIRLRSLFVSSCEFTAHLHTMMSLKSSKSNRSSRSRSTRGGGSVDSEDEVVLRLNLRDIRDRRRRGPKDEMRRLKGENGSIAYSDSRSVTSKKIDKRALVKKVSYSNSNTIDDEQVSEKGESFTQSVYTRDAGFPKAMMGEEAAINKLILEDLWSEDAETVERGLKKLSGILGIKKSSEHAARNREVIFRAGGHLAIVQAMKKHRNSDAVQGEGCRVLGIAAEEIADSGNENAIATVGGIDSILTSMRNFRGDEQIQDFGCGALQNLTGLEENSKLLLEREGLTAILMAMQNFPESTLIQESACWTIVNLCQRKENKQKIEKAKCLSCIASVIDNHPRVPQCKIAAQEALRSVLDLIGAKRP